MCKLILLFLTSCLVANVWTFDLLEGFNSINEPDPSPAAINCMNKTMDAYYNCYKKAHDIWQTIEPKDKMACCEGYDVIDCYHDIISNRPPWKCFRTEMDELSDYLDQVLDYYKGEECTDYPYMHRQLCQPTNTTVPVNPSPVNITIFDEYYCPDCHRSIVNQVIPVYDKLKSIVNIQILPFGLTDWHEWEKVNKSDGTFDLVFNQTQELGTLIQLCVVHSEPFDKSLHFAGCVYNSTQIMEPAVIAEQCSKPLGLNMTTINECAYGPLGRGLYLEAYDKVVAATPSVAYVPWTFVNGIHTEYIGHNGEKHFKKLICDAYMGPKPTDCLTE